MIPIVAAGAVYLALKILVNRSTSSDLSYHEMEDKNDSKNHPGRGVLEAKEKWISPADVLTDKTSWEWNPTIAQGTYTRDGRIRTDLISRYGRCPGAILTTND